MGMGLGVEGAGEVLEPHATFRRVAIAILANFILVPVLCWLIALALPLSDGFRIGLMLLAAGDGLTVRADARQPVQREQRLGGGADGVVDDPHGDLHASGIAADAVRA